MRLEGEIAIVVGAGQSPGEGPGNGRATALRQAARIEADCSSTPEGTRAYVQSEIEKWKPIILSVKAATE